MKQTSNSIAYSESYFDQLYNDNADPWQYQTRWYEKRKRDMCLAVLPQQHYENAIELGCGNGIFSELLAARCQSLLCLDGNTQAVQLAKERLVELSHTKVTQGIIPDALIALKKASSHSLSLSDGASDNRSSFDLIVISEILYYLSDADVAVVITWIKQNLATGGTLLCCHWRYDIEGFEMTGESVHQRLQQAFNSDDNVADKKDIQITFTHQSSIVDTDFLLDVWQHSSASVAMQENLV